MQLISFFEIRAKKYEPHQARRGAGASLLAHLPLLPIAAYAAGDDGLLCHVIWQSFLHAMALCYPGLLIVGTAIGRTRLLVLIVWALIGVGSDEVTITVHADEHAMVLQDVTVIPTHWRHKSRHLVDIPQEAFVAVVTVTGIVAVDVENGIPLRIDTGGVQGTHRRQLAVQRLQLRRIGGVGAARTSNQSYQAQSEQWGAATHVALLIT
jgi:hypothetical protein